MLPDGWASIWMEWIIWDEMELSRSDQGAADLTIGKDGRSSLLAIEITVIGCGDTLRDLNKI